MHQSVLITGAFFAAFMFYTRVKILTEACQMEGVNSSDLFRFCGTGKCFAEKSSLFYMLLFYGPQNLFVEERHSWRMGEKSFLL